VIDLTGEHPSELGRPQALLEAGQLLLDLADHGLVLLGRAELEQLLRVADVARELLDRVDLLLDVGALAGDRLRLLCVVPKIGSERRLVQTVDLVLELRDVKDAPLAS
jgi:hypothetical protein